MKKITILLLLLAAHCSLVQAQVLEDIDITAHVGYNIGGTMPLGMPESIRGLNEYTPQLNLQLGVGAEKHLTDKWGIETGLYLDRKAMKTDAKVKNYHMTMVRGGEAIEGYFTGNVVTKASTWTLSIPLEATFRPVSKLKVKAGPYLGLNVSKSFSGYAYDGYIRKDKPTGERIELGNTPEERGEYNFDKDMQVLQWGVNIGVDYSVSNKIGAFASLALGINNAFKADFKTIEQDMHPIYGTIGVTYKIK